MTNYDLILKGGIIVNADGRAMADIAVTEGRIAKIGHFEAAAHHTIDCTNRLIMPGGVDTHCHIEQLSGAGLMNADTFETATRSAAFGGTTTVVSFAAQHPGMRLSEVVADYAVRAQRGALVDYAFHVIVSDTSGDNLTRDLPALTADGHRSFKIFTTYDKVRLWDEDILRLMGATKKAGGLICVHAENDAIIRSATEHLIAEGKTAPRYHGESHPPEAETEAIARLCRLSEFTGQPVMIFHVSTAEGVEIIRRARTRRVEVTAETCTHYLTMTAEVLNQPGTEAAQFMCSPPQRSAADQAALWAALKSRDLMLVSSDHAPYRLDESGKFAHGRDAPFNKIANGMPGLELRLPVMFDEMVSQGRLSAEDFVDLTATTPARLFGLERKGRIAEGFDADIVLWDPERAVTFGTDDLHDNVGYNPFAGRCIRGWPVTVLSRGDTIVDNGRISEAYGRGRRLPMQIG